MHGADESKAAHPYADGLACPSGRPHWSQPSHSREELGAGVLPTDGYTPSAAKDPQLMRICALPPPYPSPGLALGLLKMAFVITLSPRRGEVSGVRAQLLFGGEFSGRLPGRWARPSS